MGKRIKTLFHNDGKKFAEIHLEVKDEHFYVKFFENDGRLIKSIDYPGKPLRFVTDAVENWCDGSVTLDDDY